MGYYTSSNSVVLFLRVILIKVGEEQLAAAGLSALTGQVHGLDTIYRLSRSERGSDVD